MVEMSKRRLGDTDYSRVGRTEGVELTEQARGQGRLGKRQRTTIDRRGSPLGSRERVFRRWSKASRQGRTYQYKLKRTGLNRAKWQRERGVTIETPVGQGRDGDRRQETGSYSRRAVEGGETRDGVWQLMERTEGMTTVDGFKRRGIGRQAGESMRTWVGCFEECGDIKQEGLMSRRATRKTVKKAESVVGQLKAAYRTVRRKGWRLQLVRRSRSTKQVQRGRGPKA